eukprot:scaffold146_cov265-Pinguiococcus_pyrenoidosus.AAC.25
MPAKEGREGLPQLCSSLQHLEAHEVLLAKLLVTNLRCGMCTMPCQSVVRCSCCFASTENAPLSHCRKMLTLVSRSPVSMASDAIAFCRSSRTAWLLLLSLVHGLCTFSIAIATSICSAPR